MTKHLGNPIVQERAIVRHSRRLERLRRFRRLWRWSNRLRYPGADRETGAASVFTVRQRWLLMAAFALLVIMHLPMVWLRGRFLDEEGPIFFAFAWHRETLVALLRSFGGYLNVAANATTLLDARLVQNGVVPLELAPYITMTLALPFQLLPAVLILTGRERWLANRLGVIVCLLMLVLDPMTEEVFSNVLHIQFHLALCTALILAIKTPRSLGTQISYGLILLLAPLCGPGAIILLPFFVLRSVIDRDSVRVIQTIVFAGSATIQLLIFFVPSPLRGQFLDPASLSAIMFLRFAIMPFASSVLANVIGHWVYLSYNAGGIGWWIMPILAVLYFGGLLGLAFSDRRDPAIWLIVSGLAIGGASFGGGMIVSDPSGWFSVGSGERYNFLPLALLGFGLVVLALRPRARFRSLCITLCTLTLISGAIIYFRPLKELRTGPRWSDEVATWRNNHRYQLRGWPERWLVDLSNDNAACHSVGTKQQDFRSTDASYCESAWYSSVAHHIQQKPSK